MLNCDKLSSAVSPVTSNDSASVVPINNKSEPPKAKKKRNSDSATTPNSRASVANGDSPFCTNLSLIDPVWQNIDPTPDIRALFAEFDAKFFGNTLASVEVTWSSRMTLCAGICVYEGRGALCSVRLSEPLLKFRPRSDLVETLLHEMIHAYLFITENNRDREAHGPLFRLHMKRINKIASTKISVYHNFHDEVDNYKVHWWQCNGSCRSRPPFFGLLRRAVNRAPGPNDLWWSEHQTTCSGNFIKVSEPENFPKKKKKASFEFKDSSDDKCNKSNDIRNFLCNSSETKENMKPVNSRLESGSPGEFTLKSEVEDEKCKKVEIFGGNGIILGGTVDRKNSRLLQLGSGLNFNKCENDCSTQVWSDGSCNSYSHMIPCPVCQNLFSMSVINEHLDNCLQ